MNRKVLKIFSFFIALSMCITMISWSDIITVVAHAVSNSVYEYVKKASAPYVQWLGQKENPEGAGWATGENYGYDIAGMLQHLLLKEQG